MNNIWNNIESVHRISAFLTWGSFFLIFLGLIFGIGKYFTDQREKSLKAFTDSISYSAQLQVVKNFEQKVKSLDDELVNSKTEIKDLKDRTVPVNPYLQLIRVATATIEVTIQSAENINTQYLDQGGYLAFCEGQEALMVVTSTTCKAIQIGNNQIVYRGVFDLDVTSDVTTKQVKFLKESEYIQISFAPITKEMNVLKGKAICTINNSVRIEFEIPAQKISQKLILIRNIAPAFAAFKN